MRRYTLSGEKLLFEWMEAHSAERVEKLLAWSHAVCIDPEVFTSGRLIPTHRRRVRPVFYSDVPGAETRVAFIVADAPARCVHLLSIDDDSYGLA